MGLSYRTYLVTQDDRVCRLQHAKFDRMLRNPATYRLPMFAGQRVRMASLILELDSRKPVRIIRRSFAILQFDGEGRIDAKRFGRQQFALAESALAPALAGGPDSNGTVIDAASRFVGQGGVWKPSRELTRAIDAVAMGRVPCRRL